MSTNVSTLSAIELSPAAVLYYVLYGATLALHVVLFAYVLAGAGWVAVAALRHRGGDPVGGPVRTDRLTEAADPIAATLRDWLPFALGLAITAGVAPLLFLQLVQQKAFYTANLLLSHRWMMMLPVLIVGFYLLYLAKSETHGQLSPTLKRAVAAVTFLTFAFTGYTWTENHLVTSRAAEWPALYASGRMFFGSSESAVRFVVWLFGAVPLMTVLAGWQLRGAEVRGHISRATGQASSKRLAGAGLGGLVLASLAAVGYLSTLADVERAALVSGPGAGALGGTIAGAVLLGLALVLEAKRTTRSAAPLALASLGAAVTVASNVVLRELLRLTRAPAESLVHLAKVEGAGGMIVFFVFFALNAAAIAWCIRAVLRARIDRAPG